MPKQFHVSILNKFSLVGKVALVTGGASGIGESFAFALAEAGAHVAVADLNRSRAQHVANQIRNLGVDSLPLGVDVTQSQEIESMISNVLKKWGNLNIAVNNAGVALRGRGRRKCQWSIGIAQLMLISKVCSFAVKRRLGTCCYKEMAALSTPLPCQRKL